MNGDHHVRDVLVVLDDEQVPHDEVTPLSYGFAIGSLAKLSDGATRA